jgi:hypothetical protein
MTPTARSVEVEGGADGGAQAAGELGDDLVDERHEVLRKP